MSINNQFSVQVLRKQNLGEHVIIKHSFLHIFNLIFMSMFYFDMRKLKNLKIFFISIHRAWPIKAGKKFEDKLILHKQQNVNSILIIFSVSPKN